MGRKQNPEGILAARLMGRTAAVQDQLRLNRDPDREARHRAEWPALWQKLDELLELIDW